MLGHGRGWPVLLGAVGLLLIVGAGLEGSRSLAQARSTALARAERAIATATAPLVERQRIVRALVPAVRRVIDRSDLGLTYVTVRNADNLTLVSHGRLAAELHWLPAGQARQWRAWLYRARSAEATRPLRRGGRRIGTIRYGVAWSAVLARAGASFVLWMAAFVVGLLTLAIALARSGGPAQAPRAAAHPRAGAIGWRVFSNLRGAAGASSFARAARGQDFAPIPVHPTLGPHDAGNSQAAEIDDRVAAKKVSAGKQPPGDTDDYRAAEPAPPAQAPARPLPVDRGEPVQKPAAAAAMSARARIQPKFGDTTLDLRFFPIWRGAQRRVLAGAWAALAWRSGSGEMVDAAALTQLAERQGALRAFTQWIAQRFSMLYSNWQTLELATVPILLPVPSALLGFADAEAVWRMALRRVDRDPNDLILRVKHDDPASQAWLGLPIRRALALDTRVAPPVLPAGADIVCVMPQEGVKKNATAIVDPIAELARPILFGPVAESEPWAAIIEKPGVCWFSDTPGADNLYTPRSFARLLGRYSTEPI